MFFRKVSLGDCRFGVQLFEFEPELDVERNSTIFCHCLISVRQRFANSASFSATERRALFTAPPIRVF